MAPKKPPTPAKGKPGAGEEEGAFADVEDFAVTHRREICAYIFIATFVIATILLFLMWYQLYRHEKEMKEAIKKIRAFAVQFDPDLAALPDIQSIRFAQNLSEVLLRKTLRNEALQRDIDAFPTQSNEWITFKRMIFYFSQDSQSWPEARDTCAEMGGVLAYLVTDEEQVFADKKVATGKVDFWMGLSKIPNRHDELEWINGERPTKTHWDKTLFQPDGVKELCIFITCLPCVPGNCWHDGPCPSKRNYICKLEPNPEWFQ